MAAADYLAQYQDLAPSLPGQHLAWLQKLRADALARFSAGGFPSPREEEWKYTNVAAIERKRFAPAAHLPPLPPPVEEGLSQWLLPDAYHMVFIDGRLQAELSSLPAEADGLAALLQADPGHIETLLGNASSNESHGFIHFNTAWFNDGAVLHLPAGHKLDKPLQLLFHGATPDSMAVLRNLIVLEAGAEAEVVETYTGTLTPSPQPSLRSPTGRGEMSGTAYLTAAVNEIVLGEGAKLVLTKLQSEAGKAFHFGGNYVKQAKTSVFEHHNFAFGGLLARTEVHAELAQGCDCQLNGLFLAQGQQHLDNHIRVDHRQPDAVSRETYKGILNGRSRGVFQGRVVVHEQAQHSDAAMSNRNLLLSQDAEIDTKPQLEIYADDVKCAHGVTIGQLDEESIFFLKARGLDEAEARALLTFAFANERVGAVANDALRGQIREQLLARFANVSIEKDWL